jgi:glucan 1,3-beta-glucosidase
MRFTPIIAAAILASSATAAPVADPGLISSILGLLTGTLDSVLNSIGIKLLDNYSIHGPTFVWPAIPKVTLSNVLYSHTISWPKGCSSNSQVFVDWTKFKANGVNLGSWLEKEQTHDYVRTGSFRHFP